MGLFMDWKLQTVIEDFNYFFLRLYHKQYFTELKWFQKPTNLIFWTDMVSGAVREKAIQLKIQRIICSI